MTDYQKDEYLLPDIVGELIGEKLVSVKVLRTDARWFGVTYREDRARVQKEIRALIDNGLYPRNLWR